MITPMFVALGALGLALSASNPALVGLGALTVLLAGMDVYGRVLDFKACRKYFLDHHPFYTVDLRRFIARYKGSHCQRQSLQLAAWTIEPEAFSNVNKYLHNLGYRWYHVLPDWFSRRPGVVLTRRFWRAFLGVK